MRRQRVELQDNDDVTIVVDDDDTENTKQLKSKARSAVAAVVLLLSDDDEKDDDNDDDDDVFEVKTSIARCSAALKPISSNSSSSNHNWTVRKPVMPSVTNNLSRGWLIGSRIPSSLAMSKFANFNALLSLRPKENGQVVMRGVTVDVPRYQKAYIMDYHFSGMRHVAEPRLPHPCLEELLEWANEQIVHWLPTDEEEEMNNVQKSGDDHSPSAATAAASSSAAAKAAWRFNSCLINWYLDGNHYTGAHSDDTKDLQPNSPIFSLSLGQSRTFRIRDKSPSLGAAGAAASTSRDIELSSGTLLVMGGRMQQHFTHEIVKITSSQKLVNPRINITFRCFR